MEFSLNSSRQTRYMWLTCISELAINVDQQRVVSFGYPSDKVVKSEIKQLLASPHPVRLPLYGNVRFKCYLRTGLTPCDLLSTHTIFLPCNFSLRKMEVRFRYSLLLLSARNLNLETEIGSSVGRKRQTKGINTLILRRRTRIQASFGSPAIIFTVLFTVIVSILCSNYLQL